MLKYLVTGTGRCGTVYMARLLSSIGIMCGHETTFDHRGFEFALEKLKKRNFVTTAVSHPEEKWFVAKDMIAEASYMAAPFLDKKELSHIKIIHVVRNPLQVISSYVSDIHFFGNCLLPGFPPYIKFVLNHCPEINNYETEIEKACCYYVLWNEMIEKNAEKHPAYIRLKVEQQPSRALFDFVEVKDCFRFYNNTRANSWKKRRENLTLEDIPEGTLKQSFIKICKRYYRPTLL